MAKSDPYKKCKMTETKPRDGAMHEIYVSEFLKTLDGFLKSNFLGLIEMKYEDDFGDSITVCEEYAALLFKNLIMFVDGKYYIEVVCEKAPDSLKLKINTPFDVSDLSLRARLVRTARNAGFEIEPRDDGILLTIPTHKNRYYAVYAKNGINMRLKQSLIYIFFG